ncbi:DUF2793 domain-containing protein [Altererythrobacter arenosus]|uniref:DUF2793 domain-containing protein n=1 Tax=Altererythrobacter arenosus TaxID=3032592 RepID=A0ABY8FZS4_9SPHN|nr:DUF2793 domain-containing protein [Altererythrobacter sp. CAU 1644]WFL78831.1 DUF2793 domain-containing protein [Altererythrobacter sp. CAU 1644]
MAEATAFSSRTPRFELPLLHPGQAQKEFSVNEAHALIDALLHTEVTGVATTPPPSPQEGDTWLAGEQADGAWSGFDHHLCTFAGGTWHFAPPRPGMVLLNLQDQVRMFFDDGWTAAGVPIAPDGGSVVDIEVRQALSEVVEALRQFGIFPRN